MARMSARRLPYNPSGPFLCRKEGTVGGVAFVRNTVVTAEELAHVGPRRLQLLWETHWMDVASKADIEAAGIPGLGDAFDPDTDVMLIGSDRFPAMITIGETEVQLGEFVRRSHEASGLSVEEYNRLPAGQRDALIQAEIDRAMGEALANALGAGDGSGEGDQSEDPQEPPAGAQEGQGGAEGTEPPADAETATGEPGAGDVDLSAMKGVAAAAMAEPVAVAMRSVGFGKYLREDAEGNTFGSRITKAEAEASNLPLLPQQKKEG